MPRDELQAAIFEYLVTLRGPLDFSCQVHPPDAINDQVYQQVALVMPSAIWLEQIR